MLLCHLFIFLLRPSLQELSQRLVPSQQIAELALSEVSRVLDDALHVFVGREDAFRAHLGGGFWRFLFRIGVVSVLDCSGAFLMVQHGVFVDLIEGQSYVTAIKLAGSAHVDEDLLFVG